MRGDDADHIKQLFMGLRQPKTSPRHCKFPITARYSE